MGNGFLYKLPDGIKKTICDDKTYVFHENGQTAMELTDSAKDIYETLSRLTEKGIPIAVSVIAEELSKTYDINEMEVKSVEADINDVLTVLSSAGYLLKM